MPTEPDLPETERLLGEACGWLTKLHSGHITTAEQQQLAAWRSADPSHEHAWQQAQDLWQSMEHLRSRAVPGSEPLPQERNHKPQTPLPEREGNYLNPVAISAQRRYRRPQLLAVAASALLAITLATLFPPALWQADYMTDKGEQRTVILADGTRVMLNSATALAIHFDGSVRRVELLQGEAFFEVAKNKYQPFVVAIDDKQVRAVGTAFDVERQPDWAKVELVEGIVELQNSSNQDRKRLNAGQIALIGTNTINIQNTHQTGNMALWRDGYLQFDGLPLREAIVKINQYRPGRVILMNERLANKRVSGLFRLDALDQALASLKVAVPELQTVSITPYLVVLR